MHFSYYVHGKKKVHIEYLRLFWSTGRTQVWNSSSSVKIAFKSFTVFWEIFLISTHASEQTGSPFLHMILPISSATHRLQSLKITFIIQIIHLRSRLNKYSNHPKYWSIHLFLIHNIFYVNIYTPSINMLCQYIKFIKLNSFFSEDHIGHNGYW